MAGSLSALGNQVPGFSPIRSDSADQPFHPAEAMKIAMFTNTYLPHVGGVARIGQVAGGRLPFTRARGEVIAPEFEGAVECPDRPAGPRDPEFQRQ
jgi:hypothetical protein